MSCSGVNRTCGSGDTRTCGDCCGTSRDIGTGGFSGYCVGGGGGDRGGGTALPLVVLGALVLAVMMV